MRFYCCSTQKSRTPWRASYASKGHEVSNKANGRQSQIPDLILERANDILHENFPFEAELPQTGIVSKSFPLKITTLSKSVLA